MTVAARIEPGPRYSQAVLHRGSIYLAGQVAKTWDASIESQAQEVFAEIDRLLALAGASKSNLLTLTVWLKDFADYAAYNEQYERWIDPANKPARATVRAELLDPRLRIEIAGVAALPERTQRVSSRTLLDAARAQVVTLAVEDAKERLSDPGLRFIDVRERHELDAGGMIPGALHMPRGLLEFYMDCESDMFMPGFAEDRTFVFVCGSGGRAALSAKLASDMGLRARYLEGGMKAWTSAGGPLTKPGA